MLRRWRLRKSPRTAEPAYSAEVLEILSEPERHVDVPDPRPWPGTAEGDKPVLMVPAADYHLDELVPLAAELEKRGHRCVFAVGESPWGRTKRGVVDYPDLRMYWLPSPGEVERDIALVVTLKDTGSMMDWVPAVRNRGVPVVGKVEGAQDFWDSDTPERRRPYRNFDLVLCQGQFDADALSEVETAIVGSTRLERLWNAPAVQPPETPLALINLNFVYGVRTQDRRLWLESAIEGCERAGIEHLISVHPAERTPISGRRLTRVSAMKLLPQASVLISRFSTVPLEAMAMGVPFVYHNPHAETVATYREAQDSFPETSGSADLARAVGAIARGDPDPRRAVQRWFRSFVSIEDDRTSELRGADEIISLFH